MTFEERFNICNEFNEGTEITDAVQSLVSAANTLRGINEVYKANIALSLAEQICYDYCVWLFEFGSNKDISDFPNHVYKYFMHEDKPKVSGA